MSLINKMLKDLDKRSGEASLSDTARASVRSVTLGPKKRGRPFLWMALLALVTLTAVAAWIYRDKFLKRAPTPAQANAVPLVSATPALSRPIPPVTNTVVQPQMPLQDKTASANPAPRVATVVAQASSPAARPAALAPKVSAKATVRPTPRPVMAQSTGKPAAKVPQTPVPAAMPASSPTAALPSAPATKLAGAAFPQKPLPSVAKSPSLGLPGAAARTAKAPKAESKPAPAVQTKRLSAASLGSKKMQVEVTPQQQADNDYGKAVRLLEAGRRAEAMAVLESVLMKHYKHAPARQMLAGLLVAEQRPYEAMNLLKAGLRVDSSQTDMAMLLARLQVEKGENGAALLTLQQSLTYGRVKPDYQAFIAAIYQREKRHQEAIEHYRAALGERPGHGVWWMGYGISLQAVGRAVDARTAFGQARDSGSLSPQLKTFVEQRLVELSQ